MDNKNAKNYFVEKELRVVTSEEFKPINNEWPGRELMVVRPSWEQII